MKTIPLRPLLAVPVLSLLVLTAWANPSLTPKESSRLGVIGQMVFVVTEVASFAEGAEIQVGDLLTFISHNQHSSQTDGTDQCGSITGLKTLRSAVTNSKPGTVLRVEFLRLNPATGAFENRVASITTLAHPASQSLTTLGLIGKIGLMVNEVDPSTVQPEISLGDIIVATSAFGEIVEIETFRKSIMQSQVNSSLSAEVLKFNSTHRKYESATVSLKLFPYPTTRQRALESSSRSGKVAAFATTPKTQCEENPCVWCCALCCPMPWSPGCCYSNCETGVYRYQTSPPGIKCQFTSLCL